MYKKFRTHIIKYKILTKNNILTDTSITFGKNENFNS